MTIGTMARYRRLILDMKHVSKFRLSSERSDDDYAVFDGDQHISGIY